VKNFFSEKRDRWINKEYERNLRVLCLSLFIQAILSLSLSFSLSITKQNVEIMLLRNQFFKLNWKFSVCAPVSKILIKAAENAIYSSQ
jgi:hypothetical protein